MDRKSGRWRVYKERRVSEKVGLNAGWLQDAGSHPKLEQGKGFVSRLTSSNMLQFDEQITVA